MKQAAFEEKFGPRWRLLEGQLRALDGEPGQRRIRTLHGAFLDFPQLYRDVCRDLSIAVERSYSPRLLDHLNRLALDGHRHLYRRNAEFGTAFLRFAAIGFPGRIRRDWRFVGVAAALFCVPAFFIFAGILAAPELIYSVMSAEQINGFEMMYDPEARRIGTTGTIGTERTAETDVQMFGYYIMNNIGISFRIFASGIAAGFGSALFLVSNGLLLAAVSAHVIHLGFEETFFPFVIGHGAFELSAIVLSGAAGLKLGYALVAPGNTRRVDALRSAAAESVQIIYGVIAMLVVAALLEAFWSSKASIPASAKLVGGAVLWAAVAAYFGFAGRRAAPQVSDVGGIGGAA